MQRPQFAREGYLVDLLTIKAMEHQCAMAIARQRRGHPIATCVRIQAHKSPCIYKRIPLFHSVRKIHEQTPVVPTTDVYFQQKDMPQPTGQN